MSSKLGLGTQIYEPFQLFPKVPTQQVIEINDPFSDSTFFSNRTYMAASGLNPKHQAELGLTDEDAVCDIVEFAIAMRQKLQEVNKDAFNTFQLRVGISSGPLVSGVIGARKPIFDIWGNSGETCHQFSIGNHLNDKFDNSERGFPHGFDGRELEDPST